jgi:hypothetical protein
LLLNKFNQQELIGNYTIITWFNNKICIIPDQSNILNIYYNTDKIILSSSILAIHAAMGGNLELDKLSIAENLLTGYLIGPSTFFKKIKRIEPSDYPSFEHIKFSFIHLPESPGPSINIEKGVQRQLSALSTYFSKVKNFADEYGVDSGITSGHDSRLNMAFMRKYWQNVSYHSHFRKIKDHEVQIAELVCRKAGVKNNQVEVKSTMEMSETELKENLSEAFHFFDGHVKSHAFYNEGYNTPSYREKLLNEKKIGVSGIAGEIYRNAEGMTLPFWRFKNFVRYKIVYNFTGKVINDQKFETAFFDSIEHKIRKILSIEKSRRFVTLSDIKRYLVQVYIPSCLGSRNNAENTLSFFLSPFADPWVASNALADVKWLGFGNRFQQKMIYEADPQLADVMSDYGYTFSKGEPFKRRLINLVKDLIPEYIKQDIFDKKLNKENQHFEKMYEQFQIIRDCFSAVENLRLPIDLHQLKKRADMAPIIIGIGYVLLHTNRKVQ